MLQGTASLAIVTELAANGDLRDVIRKQPPQVSESMWVQMAHDIAKGEHDRLQPRLSSLGCVSHTPMVPAAVQALATSTASPRPSSSAPQTSRAAPKSRLRHG